VKATIDLLRETRAKLLECEARAAALSADLEKVQRENDELQRKYSAQNDELDGAKFERTQLINAMERVALMLDTSGK
jgi:hypothetical protein